MSAAASGLLPAAVVSSMPPRTGGRQPGGRDRTWERLTTPFTRVEIRDREVSVADGGRTIFVDARGDLLVAATGEPYRNVYVFRFTFDAEGLITDLREYANPVPILGIPVGRPSEPVPTSGFCWNRRC